MTPREALQLLRSVWGGGSNLSAKQAEQLASCAQEGETSLATCARLAGVDVSGVKAFDTAHIYALCSRREAEMDLARARQ